MSQETQVGAALSADRTLPAGVETEFTMGEESFAELTGVRRGDRVRYAQVISVTFTRNTNAELGAHATNSSGLPFRLRSPSSTE